MMLKVEQASGPLSGSLKPPGDKSISHRALILSALADGTSVVRDSLDSDDLRATRFALQQMGAVIRQNASELHITGLGQHGLQAPTGILDMGNSGTAMRLLAGVLAAQPFDSVLSGDQSLNRRPMLRILKPLRLMGAKIEGSGQNTAPLHISGRALHGIVYDSPVASAQIKSCLLLAGLYASGRTQVREPELSRDHTERMLPLFGVELPEPCTVVGGSRLKATELDIPADISSAAFLIAAALVVPGSRITLQRVGLNPARDGFVRAVCAMGGNLRCHDEGDASGDPLGTIEAVYSGRLRAIDLDPAWVPSMVDEIPVLMVLAATARGTTRIRGARELRVKESDRLAVMGKALEQCGVAVTLYDDGADITGTPGLNHAVLDSASDHRCAMSLAILGLTIKDGLLIEAAEYIATSYPGFEDDMRRMGARLGMVST